MGIGVLIRARRFLDEHGQDAVPKAADIARSYAERGDQWEAETWRRIEETIREMQDRGRNGSGGN